MSDTEALIQKLLTERPLFHRSETETDRTFDPSESFLPHEAAVFLSSGETTCYAIGADVLRFLAETVGAKDHTLETGAGLSTLTFAIRRANHVAVTPSQREIENIQQYALRQGIRTDTVQFAAQSSETFLPNFCPDALDLVLIDGKHAFPWPILDWFFTAGRLRLGGLMLVDDIQLRSVAILTDFMKLDSGWELIKDFSGKAFAFRKVRENIHDIAWHMQRWTVAEKNCRALSKPGFLKRLLRGT